MIERIVFGLLAAVSTLALLGGGFWASSIHTQLARIEGSLASIATSSAARDTDMAVLKLRVDRLEQAAGLQGFREGGVRR